MYKCLNCNKNISLEELKKRVRCPYCGYRILVKKRQEIIRNVKAT